MKKNLQLWAAISASFAAFNVDAGTPEQANLLITEIAAKPATGEFIEIHNKGAAPIDLSNVYLTDATYSNGGTYYYQLVTGGGGGGGFADFYARFPDGASIAPGAYQTVALNGAVDFNTAYGIDPTYEIANTSAVPDMREARTGSIDGLNSGLTDDGEVVVLAYWNGQSDLMQDIDYVLWGDKTEAIDKTGVSIDGPDGDSNSSTYQNDTSIANQAIFTSFEHADGNSWQRSNMNEGNETTTGGNGITGSDETSEDLNNTFFESTPTPNAAAGNPPAPQIIINELDAVGTAEFIELKGSPNSSTDGVTLVMYDGGTNQVSDAYDLSGNTFTAEGYFLIGDSSLTPNYLLPPDSIADGADAIAIYYSDVANFPNGSAITSTDILDALVYGSGQSDDTDLLALMNIGQAQVNEDANSNAASESLARCPNGSGGSLNSLTYQAVDPTPGLANSLCPIGEYYATADDTDASTLRTSLHEIIDDHVKGNYTSGPSAFNTWDMLSFADEDPTDQTKVWMVYKNNSYTFIGGGDQVYNREHTWPQSYGFKVAALGTNNAARTDGHHLMMSDKIYNQHRDNLYFDNCSSGCTEDVTTANHGQGGAGISNKYDTNSYEVWDFRKGDIARAMFYMDVRYSGDVPGEVDLQLTDNPNLINQDDPYMGLLSVLLEWHEADPVDDIERDRNERIYSYQENRNPFIDHPEWVECIFVNGGECTTESNDIIFTSGFEQQ
ncbi:endonuclease [Marinicella rhabdoformis]|uniref:endonuclease n=1 Tax=Marinicella rhabdoformis TaxID=2580566 RepID=UPI0012AED0FE|nr:endonuclease [Marinicella rhabdoformis]